VRTGADLDFEVAGTQGVWVLDRQGRRHLDFFAGWCVGNLGWARREIVARMRAFRGPTYLSPHFRYEGWEELARRLAALAPGRLRRCHRAVGGTEAVEVALQTAMAHTGRRRFLSLDGAYHGNSLAARMVGDASERRTFGDLLPGAKLALPLDDEALGRAERALRKEDVAAAILEPVACSLGAYVPRPGFLRGLKRLCEERGTLLVLDEVACGFGRTGRMFAAEHDGVEPDIMTLAKAITGGHAPMGATLVTEEVAEATAERLGFYSTFGWHPLAVEAALANLDYMERHRDRLMRNVAARGRQLRRRLDALDLADAEVQGIGLAWGVRSPDKKWPVRVAHEARRRGLLVDGAEGCLRLFPALTMDARTAGHGMDLLEEAVRAAG
jgi:acetylornithine/succinyldiaminopimelate/putrescine aminotransferase